MLAEDGLFPSNPVRPLSNTYFCGIILSSLVSLVWLGNDTLSIRGMSVTVLYSNRGLDVLTTEV